LILFGACCGNTGIAGGDNGDGGETKSSSRRIVCFARDRRNGRNGRNRLVVMVLCLDSLDSAGDSGRSGGGCDRGGGVHGVDGAESDGCGGAQLGDHTKSMLIISDLRLAVDYILDEAIFTIGIHHANHAILVLFEFMNVTKAGVSRQVKIIPATRART